MSEKITTGRVEEVLLQKAQKECIKEIKDAAHAFANIVNRYCPEGNGAGIDIDRAAFVKWATGALRTDCWQVFVADTKVEKEMPEGVKRLILKRAVDEFLQSIESTREIVDSLEI